jgi:thiamine pyrophosphate-dependent acetolactate synthase large subunit-like protein
VKWDEQPASPRAGMEATLRAWQLANTHPKAPTYVCFDVSDLEQQLDPDFPLLDVTRFAIPSDPVPDEADVAKVVEFLRHARRPLIMLGRSSRKREDWERRIRLAELLGAAVLTDTKTPSSFPTEHPLHVREAGMFLSAPQKAAIFEADVILALDWVDLGGTLFQSFGHEIADRVVISVSVDDGLANGWNYDHFMLPPVTLKLAATPENVVDRLLAACGGIVPRSGWRTVPAQPPPAASDGPLDLRGLARAVGAARRGRNVTLIRLPIGWPNDETPFSDSLDYLGADGGAGIGSGPGMAVGAALALREGGRVPVAILGDGDFIMGAGAIWTATHYRIPLLIIVANNRSYFNDETHQETVARVRGRQIENRWIGQRLDDPPVDLDHLAKSMGAVTRGDPVEDADTLASALETALAAAEAGATYVLDVRVTPGYSTTVTASASKAGQS